MVAHSADAERKRGDTQQKQHQARQNWDGSAQPAWLTEQVYCEQIQPRLGSVQVKEIAATLGVSIPYASFILDIGKLSLGLLALRSCYETVETVGAAD
jgi:hypothetical protein